MCLPVSGIYMSFKRSITRSLAARGWPSGFRLRRRGRGRGVDLWNLERPGPFERRLRLEVVGIDAGSDALATSSCSCGVVDPYPAADCDSYDRDSTKKDSRSVLSQVLYAHNAEEGILNK